MLELIRKSSLAGLLIGLAACIYVSVINRISGIAGSILGSGLFSIGLIAVILLQSFLYTGKVGYIRSKKELKDIFLILLMNLVTAYLTGFIYNIVYGEQVMMAARLAKSWYQMFVDSIFTGMLIYLAVELYKKSQKIITVILPVIAFILAGFEHSIACVAFMAMSGFTWLGLLYILIAIIGNAIGSLLISFLQMGVKKCITAK